MEPAPRELQAGRTQPLGRSRDRRATGPGSGRSRLGLDLTSLGNLPGGNCGRDLCDNTLEISQDALVREPEYRPATCYQERFLAGILGLLGGLPMGVAIHLDSKTS